MRVITGWMQTAWWVTLGMALTLNVALAQEAINESRQVSPNEKIRLDVMRGNVSIRTHNENVLVVRGTLDEDAEGYELETANGFTAFTVTMPRRLSMGLRQRKGSELEILVPVNSDVEFSGVNVDVDANGVQGGARLKTVNGAIRATNLAGFVTLDTVNGPIASSANAGRIEINTVNGEIDERRSSGRLSMKAVNGRLSVDSIAETVSLIVVNGRISGRLQGVRELDMESVNGSISLQLTDSRSPRLAGSTVNGGIELSFDDDVSARFSLRSNSGGNIVNRLSSDEATRPSSGQGRRLEFSSGDGAGDVTLTSLNGRLELRRN
jgi:hypothetical protein